MMGATSDAGSISRILYGVAAVTVIPLGRPLLDGSSDLPGSLAHRAGTHEELLALFPIPSLFGLAPCGVCHAPRITERAVRSYRTFSPLPGPKSWRYILCGTFRLTDLNPQSRTLSGTLLFEVRTFLSPLRAAQNIWRSRRDSDHPIQHQLNTIIRRLIKLIY